jgi:hypothetical protein
MNRKVTQAERHLARGVVGAFNLGLLVLLSLAVSAIVRGCTSPGGPDGVAGFGVAVAYAVLAALYLSMPLSGWLRRACFSTPGDAVDHFFLSPDVCDDEGRGG